MDDDLTGLAVVVGGASGIGRHVVAQQRAAGATVVVWDIRGDHDLTCDVSDPAQVDAAMAATVERWGVPGWCTVSAGVGHAAMLLDVEPDDWDRIQAVNARGPLLAMRACARRMIEAGTAGSIVVTSSVSAHLPDRSMGAYCASKAALDMVVKVAAVEWASYGIRVNAVAPGVTDTPMLGGAPLDRGWLRHVAARTPLGAVGSPDAIARAVVALHGLPWVTGQVLPCDGGLALHSPIDPTGHLSR